MTRKQFVLSLGTLAGASCFLGGCSLNPGPPLRVGAIVWPGYEPLFLARALGAFERRPIKLVEYPSTPEAIRAFRNGALEVVALTGDEFLRLAAVEPTARAFLVTDFSHGADALIAHPEVESLQKLAGQRVGVEVNAAGVFVLTRALDSAGMRTSDIQVVPVDNDQHGSAFERKAVQAVVTFEPTRTRILKSGGRILFDSSKIPGEVSDLLVTRTTVLQQRPRLLKDLLTAWFQAREYLLNKTLEAASLIARRENLTPAEFAATLELIRLPSREENLRLLSGANSDLMSGLHKIREVLRQTGQFDSAEPSLELLDGGALA